MFELLLQADKALASGLLEQAEKTYWQLIELDPTNAIAVSGLARVAMERGDKRMAREFAVRALAIDPDSILARRIVETIDHKTTEASEGGSNDLPMLAAQQLEALSRRRAPEVARPGPEPDGDAKPAAQKAEAPRATTATPVAAPESAPAAGKKTAGTAAGRQANESRGKTRPDQIVPLPSEPLKERRKAGRLAAAAAAAAAAAREPVKSRHQPHHAMPVGRYRFDPGVLHAPPADEFSAAEMAAAVAAVDALDDAAMLEAMEAADTANAATQRAAEQAEAQAQLLGAVEATNADDSVALRLALLSGHTDPEAAEGIGGASVDDFSAAEAEATAGLSGSMANPVARSRFRAQGDDFDAAESASFALAVDAEPVDAVEPAAGAGAAGTEAPGEFDLAEADAAEADAAAEALHEVATGAADTDQEPAARRRHTEPPRNHEPSEEEAEAQALREAMAIVLAGDGGEAAPEAEPTRIKAEAETATESETVAPADEPADAPADEQPPAAEQPPADEQPVAEPKVVAEYEEIPEPAPKARPRHKGGLFHRIRGS
jgi:tetratricopeptide (TPR) repeat protein